MNRLHQVELIESTAVTADVTRLVFSAPEVAKLARPGQFLHVKVGGEDAFYLRRPISIHDVIEDRMVLLVRRVGYGTNWLADRPVGSAIDLIGPLGTGFDSTLAGAQSLVVGGGIGCGPLLYLLRSLKVRETPGTYIVGGRHAADLFSIEDFSSVAKDVLIATDDGSQGHKGLVTELLASELNDTSRKYEAIFACGPEPMLKAVSAIAAEHGIPCEVSVEALMACGIGVCLSCVHKAQVDGSTEYVRVCKEGPVFNTRSLVWGN